MKIENQVCTLDQGTKLKGLGVSKFSHFTHHVIQNKKDKKVWHYVSDFIRHDLRSEKLINTAPAYSVAELGIMLQGISIMPEWKKDYNKCNYDRAYITCVGPAPEETYASAKTEAEARAQLLIYMIERKDLNVEEINQRLIEA